MASGGYGWTGREGDGIFDGGWGKSLSGGRSFAGWHPVSVPGTESEKMEGFLAMDEDVKGVEGVACVAYVDRFIGTDGRGNCLCGPFLPFSLVRLGPDTLAPQSTNGYSSTAPVIYFSHTHVSGTGGGSRYGNIGVMPFTGRLRLTIEASERVQETASPGYYAT